MHELALEAVDRATLVLPDDLEAGRLRRRIEKRAEFAVEAEDVDITTEPLAELAVDDPSWKITGGTLERQRDRLRVESGRATARVTPSERLDTGAFEVRVGLRFDGKPNGGLALDTGRKGKLVAWIQGSGLRLRWDGREETELGRLDTVKASAGRWHDIGLRVSGRWVRVLWGGKEVLSAEAPDSIVGRPEIHVRGTAELRRYRSGPTASEQLSARAEKLFSRGKRAEAAILLREAARLDPDDLRFHARWAEAEERSGHPRAATRILEDFCETIADRGLTDRDLLRDRDAAATALTRLHSLDEELRALDATCRDAFLALGDGSLAAGSAERADAAFAAALRVDPDSARARMGHLRTYDLRHAGDDGFVPLDIAPGLDGWSVLDGTPTIEGAEFYGHGAIGKPIEASYTELPDSSRYILAGEYRSHGMYELGWLLGSGDDRRRIVLRNVFRKKNVTVEDINGSPRYQAELGNAAPAVDAWHDFSLLVDRNRVFLQVDGERILSKNFAGVVASRPGVYIAPLTKGRFRNLRVRLLNTPERYREHLAAWNVPVRLEIEAEEAFETGRYRGGNGDNFHAHAFNGAVLGEGWGAKEEHFARYSFTTFDTPGAMLHLRYAFQGAKRAIRVSLDGGRPVELMLEPSAGRNQYRMASLALGDLALGRHHLQLTPSSEAAAVDLDRLVIAGPDYQPDDFSGIVETDDLSNFEIRVSPGVPLPLDEEVLYPMLREIHDYMVSYLGFELERPLTLNIISRECWADPHVGGYATGNHLYVPIETVMNDIGVVIHELSHCFDFGKGFFPPWLGEGKSVPIIFDFLEDTRKKYAGRIASGRDARSKAGRTSQRKLMEGKETLIQYWGTPRLPYRGSPLRGACYDTAAFYCAELHRRFGSDWLRAFHTLMRADLDRGQYYMPVRKINLANSILIDYLSRAAGEDLVPMFQDWGFTLIDVYRSGQVLEADCGDDDEEFLTHRGTSTVVAFGDEGRARRLQQEEMVYAFPVLPATRRVQLELTLRGAGKIIVGDQVLTPPADGTTLSVTLTDPAAWESSRLALRFRAAGPTEGALEIAQIMVTAEPTAR